MSEPLIFKTANESDLTAVLRLLSENNLPAKGVRENFADFTIAHDKSGRIAAVAGIEQHGAIGLLRSVAVASEVQNHGIGSQIVRVVLQKAKAEGLKEVVLLTTSARDFFVRRFGFAETERKSYDEILHNSSEWTLPRCSAAIVMRLDLSANDFGKYDEKSI